MKAPKKVQYTLRSVPPSIDAKLRKLAKEKGVSMNQELLKIIGSALIGDSEALNFDLDFLSGSWHEDKGFNDAIEKQSQIDKESWKP